METLEEKIAKVTAEHNIEVALEKRLTKVKKILPDLDINICENTWKSDETEFSVRVDLTKQMLGAIPSVLTKIIEAFKPTRNNFLGFAGHGDIQTESPYLLRAKNGINTKEFTLEFMSGQYDLRIKLPVDHYKEVLHKGSRGVTDSELHYYGGTSMAEIRKMSLNTNCINLFETQPYYGGDIVSHILDKKQMEEFEYVIINGKQKHENN